MENISIDSVIKKLASMKECSDGWMSAYYRQTSRLLRAESALRDISDRSYGTQNPRLQVIHQDAENALEEIKE